MAQYKYNVNIEHSKGRIHRFHPYLHLYGIHHIKPTQQTGQIDPMLDECWADVVDANTTHRSNARPMLAHRLRRRPSIRPNIGSICRVVSISFFKNGFANGMLSSTVLS